MSAVNSKADTLQGENRHFETVNGQLCVFFVVVWLGVRGGGGSLDLPSRLEFTNHVTVLRWLKIV